MITIGQDYRITLDTGINLTGATVHTITYLSPNGTTAALGGTIYQLTKLYADVPAATNNLAGKWLFRCNITLAGLVYTSETIFVNVRPLWHPWSR